MVKPIMWNELRITTQDRWANQLGDQLTLLGAAAVSFVDAGDQPIYEPKPGETLFWPTTIVVGLFEDTIELKPILDLFTTQQTCVIQQIEVNKLAEEAWERRCLIDFKPMNFGKRLWLCPSWLRPPDPKAVNIILDPGLAFGTGTHPTTRLCLEWLDEHIQGGERVIDYGCGSGILGIAALKLGASNVLAIDHDPQALSATISNAEKNECSNALSVKSFPDETDSPADLLIANILAGPLIELAPLFERLTLNHVVLSGILSEQVEAVTQAFKPWIELSIYHIRDGWSALHGKKK